LRCGLVNNCHLPPELPKNPLDLFHFLANLFRMEAEVIAAFVIGVIVTIIVAFTLRHWLFPSSDAEAELAKKDIEIARKDAEISRKERDNLALEQRLQTEQQQAAAARKRHRREKANLQATIDELTAECERSKEQHLELANGTQAHQKEVDDLRKDLDLYKRKAVTVVRKYRKQLAEYTDQAAAIEAMEGRIWEAPPRSPIPPFRPAKERKASIIAVVNLKGGVGKTSLTANLAATYRRRGNKVLAVDLDPQASLTNLCLPLEHVHDLMRGDGKLIENVLNASADFARVAWNNLTHLGDDGSCLLAASEHLTDVEELVKARWLLKRDAFDMRYLLRSALHDSLIQDRFDLILLDCPPCWTPASINALTCCDFVLIPVLLDRTSAEAVPRLLTWLRILKQKNICPDLELAGVIGNRANPRNPPVKREKRVWEILEENCQGKWPTDVHLFERWVPTSPRIAEAADERAFAVDDEGVRAIFEALVDEIEERKVQHERGRLATVS